MVVGAAASSRATAAASRASYQARVICRQIRPLSWGFPPWSQASREMDTLPDTADGVMVCAVAVNVPRDGSTPSLCAATMPELVLNFGRTNGVMSARVPLLKEFQYPIWSTIDKGTLADITPFVLPKFNTSSGMVAAHSEGVEPSLGTFTATAQTITPSAVSGKVSISREAWDQGGNPQLSGLIWRQMTRAWYEALEAAAVALLEAAAPTTITVPTAAQDDTLTSYVESALAGLQFVRGGFRMRDFFGQVDFYQALVGATDADGRKLLPVLGPTNAPGQAQALYGSVEIGRLPVRPAWALAATGTVSANSYLFDRNDVNGWATAPQRLQFEQVEVRYVHVGIWGYKALAITDLTGVRRFAYDPA